MDTQAGPCPYCQRLPPVRRTGKHPGLGDIADPTHGLELGEGLVPGADDSDRGSVGPGQVPRGNPRCRARSDPALLVGLDDSKQIATIGVVKVQIERDQLPAKQPEGLDSHDTHCGRCRGHDAKLPIGQRSMDPRRVGGAARSLKAEPLLHRLKGDVHRQQLFDVLVGEVDGQLALRVDIPSRQLC